MLNIILEGILAFTIYLLIALIIMFFIPIILNILGFKKASEIYIKFTFTVIITLTMLGVFMEV